jgi:CelD/BcsL family acetyltransferase involved in cellulose biosynthesis
MLITRIEDLHHLDEMKGNWEAAYSADPHAHIFVSWMWLRGWLEVAPFPWLVLAARPTREAPYVAFLPLNMRIARIGSFNLIRELRMGGKPLGGYTGFVCLPGYEEEAITAFAAHLQQQLNWDSFQMEHVLDARLDPFLQHFPKRSYHIQQIRCISSTYIPLPSSWQEYLRDYLGRETRKNLQKHLRRIERQTEFSITYAQEDNLEKQIEAAHVLNQSRWGQVTEHKLHWQCRMFRHCFEYNSLWIGILWRGPRPIAAQVGLIDYLKSTFYCYFTGYDEEFAKLSPGTVMFAHTIQYATEHGLRTCDFLMGEDAYKMAFGARQRAQAITLTIERRNPRSAVANASLRAARKIRDFRKQSRH